MNGDRTSRYGPLARQDGLVPPVLHASTYVVDSAQELADLLDGRASGYSYARIDNPTADAFAAAVAALETPADGSLSPTGQAFASGMAAISTTLLALLEPGDHVVAPASCYGGTYALLRGTLARFGVTTTFADQSRTEAMAAAITPRTRVIWAESFANPTMLMADLPALAQIAADATFVVDSTFASPAMLRPLEWGADLVVHSATKYLGGHSDATGGALVGRPELVERVRAARVELGPVLAPDEAYLLHRGLATLAVRVQRQCGTASTLASALASHPALERVDHPSLPGHPSAELARRLCDCGRYGGVLTLSPRGGRAAGMAFVDGLREIPQATSLGGVHTTASHAASSSHRQLDDAALLAAGLLPSGVRVSVGLEPADLLLADLAQALDALG